MPWIREVGASLCLLVVVLFSGCDGNSNAPTLVRGQVHYQGRPLQGGAIVFAPDPERGTEGEVVVGTVGLDGTYVVHEGGRPVLKPGWYRVSIAPTAAGRWPDKFRDPCRSGLECEVRRGQENVFNFNLE